MTPETETIEAPADDSPSTLPISGEVEVGGDIDAAVIEEHEIARAESEGLPPVPDPDTRSVKQQIEDAERLERIEEATAEVCSFQEIAERKKSAYLHARQDATDAKKAAESADDDYRDAGRRLRKLREGRFPDPDKHPLFDKPDPIKAQINADFPVPESIPPTAPDTFEEALRRAQRDAPINVLALKKTTIKALEDLGLKTVGDVVRKWNEVLGSGGKLSSMKGVTDARQEEIATALAEFSEALQIHWDAAAYAEELADSDDDTAEE